MTIEGDAEALQELLRRLERSIRVIQVVNL